MSNFVGKLISIVDTKSVRYVGTLESISAETSSLVLKNVKVYGTEDRISDESKKVKEEPVSRSNLVFKGTEVNDLQVLEQKVEDDDEEDFVLITQRLIQSEEKVPQTYEKVYNKSNSFFDNLGDGEDQRTRNNRGGRGRGHGRGRGRGRGGRGGYRSFHQYNENNERHGDPLEWPSGGRGRGRGRGGSRGGHRNGSNSEITEFIPDIY